MRTALERTLPSLIVILTLGPRIVTKTEAAVVMEEVREGSPAALAGIQAGDVLLTWHRGANPPLHPESARGELRTPLDYPHVWGEQKPRGPVTITGTSNGVETSWSLPSDDTPWGLIRLAPRLDAPDAERWKSARDGLASDEITPAVAAARELATELAARGRRETAAWMLDDVARTIRKTEPALADALQSEARAALGDSPRPLVLAWLHEVAASRRAKRDPEGAARERERAVALREQVAPASFMLARTLERLAWAASNRRQPDAAEAFHRRVLAVREALVPESFEVAKSLSSLGRLARQRGDLDAAEELHGRALAIIEKNEPDSVNHALALNSMAAVAERRGNIDDAKKLYLRALGLKERHVPDSMSLARSLNNLGVFSSEHGDLEAAEEYYLRAIELKEKLAPNTTTLANSITGLASVQVDRGQLAAAEKLSRRALTIVEDIAPESMQAARTLSTIASIAIHRGDLAAAESLRRRSLAIREAKATKMADVAAGLNDLGSVLLAQRDFAAAEDYFRRGLEIQERLSPVSSAVARTLKKVGNAVFRLGDLTTAEAFYRRSLAIEEQVAPGSLKIATTLNNLAVVAKNRGEHEKADALHHQSLAMKESLAPGTLDVATSLNNLGTLELERGDFATAEDFYRRSLSIKTKLAPGTKSEAMSLHMLSRSIWKQGRLAEATEVLRQALRALEQQVGRLGGSEERRTDFAESHADWYRNLVQLLVEQGQAAEAFGVLERSRGRQLVSLLHERDLVFTADVPEELERERNLINASYERTQAELAGLGSAADGAEGEALRRQLRELRLQQDAIRAKVREASPRLADLRDPLPLDLRQAQRALDRRTLLLAYSVGEDRMLLFAVTRRQLAVHEVDISREKLARHVRRLRNAIVTTAGSEDDVRRVRRLAARLSDWLLSPVAKDVAKADRLLLMPDGPLHHVPFAVLDAPESRGEESPAYLVQSLPLHSSVSMTVQAALKSERTSRRPVRLAALGDPDYRTGMQGALLPAVVRSASRIGEDGALSLAPLPATRDEVLGLSELFGDDATSWLGSEATEEHAKSLGEAYSHVHFAVHGLVDEQFPLDSALALAIPPEGADDRDNGLLQAWEIFESVRLDAELVTLSACETGLGKELGGEGIIGLTRAFHHAGARSVLSSLWSVNDASTSELMTRFYRHLERGKPKDAALRAAQLELMSRPISVGSGDELDATHPYHWAAFVLSGDWK